jgi:ATP-dependent Clp protease ATP-binding subunit ClpC
MARRRRNERVERVDEEDVEAVVRQAASSIAARFESQWPEFGALAQDHEFIEASDRLAYGDVPRETVDRLARASNPIVAAAAHRATALRPRVGDDWLDWAYRRLKSVYAGEVLFLLQAIERHGEPPFIARVLARSDDDWSRGWLLDVVTQFVERRVRAGEHPTAAEFEAAVQEADEQTVAEVVEALEGVLPADSIRDFRDWRRDRTRRRFFASLGRIWSPRPDEPTLTTVGGRESAVLTLRDALGDPQGRSVLLVGEAGVGKSAVIREALARLDGDERLVVEAAAADVMAGQIYIGQLEGRVQEIVEQASGARVVWVVPGFEATVWAGQHSRSPRGLLDAILPHVTAGRLVVIGEIEPEAYELLSRQRPRIASVFETVRLEPITREEAIAVATDWRDRVEADIEDETIADAQDLAQHYLASVAAPAGALRVLKAARVAAARDGRNEIRGGDVLETLSETTGLPLRIVDPETPLDLEAVWEFFSSRVLGQPEAVDCIVDRIALIKANLTDPSRPFGVFLFVGPTGTGKTEIAKTLAEFLFGSADRLVRLDMTEFQTERSFERLLGDASSDNEAATLIASVRAKPFSVVLLDEFEKAHRNIWSLFLQLFDDGRLTDRRGRAVDFRRCVVVLTSNFGAAVESGNALGFATDSGPTFRPAAVERELARAFPPEFLNRIDRVVVFRPFKREQIRALLERELAQVLARRGFRGRPWAIEWDESALEFLAEKGFSAELGARPLKRAVERYLLAPLASAIVTRSFPQGEQFLFITAGDDRIEVTFVDPDADDAELPAAPAVTGLSLERLVLGAPGGAEERAFLRAETERLTMVIEGEGWAGRKERDLEAMRSDAFWKSPERFGLLARVEYVDRVQAALRTAQKLADRLDRLGRNGRGPAHDLVRLLAARLYLLDRAGFDATLPADAFLEIVWSGADREEQEFAGRLLDMYESWARRRGMKARRLWAETGHLLSVSGIGSFAILSKEAGLHVFELPQEGGAFDRAVVRVTLAPQPATVPDADVVEVARAALAAVEPVGSIVRRYRAKPSPLVRDSVRNWRTGKLDRVLAGDFDVIASE